ncbi:hypothetical protein MNBD_GAMMA13-1967 [hydrothermal vent metagenome]|uniref:Serine/threonine kinase n=1 Tax=hydrothermal vent metagenome TaxID=652676 RepID=A0A3B0YSC9_9ZZZZ
MKRVFLLTDANGDRQFAEDCLPITLGGAAADIVLPGLQDEVVVAHIALTDGHAFIQPESGAVPLFHNHERLQASAWLKSGDQVQLGQVLLHWQVKGDQVYISMSAATAAGTGKTGLTPPLEPPENHRPLPVVEAVPAPVKNRSLNLEKSVGSRKSTQALGAPGKPEKLLITNKVTTNFSDSPCTPISCMSFSRPTDLSRLKRGIVAVLAVLVLLALFVLLATPVEIQITPEPEAVAVKGMFPLFSLAGRRLALPGNYRITAVREGYFDIDEPLSVNNGGLQIVKLVMHERPGRITLKTLPDVAIQLFVDAEPVELDASSTAGIERGEHRLRIQTDWYLPVERVFDVIGLGRSQILELTLLPAWADVQIRSQPEGAQVRNNGELLGVTPLETRLLKGEQRLMLEKKLFKTASLEVNVIAGEALLLDAIVLTPADGQLKIESQPEVATLQVDGHYQGTTPTVVALSSGTEHQLQLSKPGYTAWRQSITLEPGQLLSLKADLKPAYATIFINAEPADAKLRVDGKAQGNATQRLRLTSRSHRLEIYRDGYETWSLTVTPDAANSRTFNVALKTAAQARIEATPTTIAALARQLLRLVRPDGRFMMGASRREAGRRANESPRLIELKRPFYFGEKEVTNAEYRQFRQQHRSGRADGADLDGDQQPVAGISHADAARYCNWLSRKQGLPEAYRLQAGHMQLVRPVNTGYRLPSEAEWAYVARKLGRTDIARYPWSGSYPPTQVIGNFADARISDTLAETISGYDDQYRGSAPVGSFSAFPEGFYDLGGNVAEWMNDYYAVYPGEASQLVQDPFGPDKGKHYVVRGSSWRHGNITELRLSYRDYSRKPRADIGFRLARYAD